MSKMEIYTIEHSPDRDQTDHVERKLSEIVGDDEEKSDKNEALKEAQEALIDNKSLYNKFLEAIIKIDENRDTRGFIQIENLFISNLLELSDAEIDSIIRQFNIGFRRFVMEYKGSIALNTEQKRKIFENDAKNNKEIRGNIHENSIKNVISFIRTRKELLESNPSQEYGFYVQDALDAHYSIDLIECLYNKEGGIDVMNLIQIKSSKPDKETQEKIVSDHKEWIHSSVMDMEMFEKEYSNGVPEGLSIEVMADNADQIEELLINLCTDPEGFSADKLLSELDLGDLSNKQRAWLLMKYGKIVKEKINEAAQSGIITEEDVQPVLQALGEIEDGIKRKAKVPRNLSYINEIRSITAIGAEIVHEEVILSGDTVQQKKKIFKTN